MNVPVHLHTHIHADFCKDTERPASQGSLPASLGVPASTVPSPLFEGTVSSRGSERVKDNEEGRAWVIYVRTPPVLGHAAAYYIAQPFQYLESTMEVTRDQP